MSKMKDKNDCLIFTLKNQQLFSSYRSLRSRSLIKNLFIKSKKYKKIVYFGFCAEKAENNWPRRYGVPQKPPEALFGRICKIEGRKNPPISLQRTSATRTRNLHHRLNSRAPSYLDENHEMNYLDIITILHNSIKRQFSWFWPINQFFNARIWFNIYHQTSHKTLVEEDKNHYYSS